MIAIAQPDARAICSQRDREIRGDGGFADAAFAASDRDDVLARPRCAVAIGAPPLPASRGPAR